MFYLNDKWLRIIGIPLTAIFMSYIFHKEVWLQPGLPTLQAIGISAIFTIFIWEVNCQIYVRTRKRYPGFENTKQRIIFQGIFSIIFTILTNIIVKLILGYLDVDPQSDISDPECFIFIFIPVVLISTIYESVYFFNAWKENVRKTEKLASMHLETQFEALKKQLDPHFLFNSLNTLASLIDINNESAQLYLEHLSDVYRYVLETRNKPTVTLTEELEFLEAYLYLNKIRFRENIQIKKDIPQDIQHYHIPSLSLQLLVENAIKHNIISKESPLNIHIFQDQGYLTILNNKQLKTRLERSTKLGLNNLIHRYKLLTTQPIEIENGQDKFSVKLPLLKPAYV